MHEGEDTTLFPLVTIVLRDSTEHLSERENESRERKGRMTVIEKQIGSPNPRFNTSIPKLGMANILKLGVRCIGGVLSSIYSGIHEMSNSVKDNMERRDTRNTVHLKAFIHFSPVFEEQSDNGGSCRADSEKENKNGNGEGGVPAAFKMKTRQPR